MSFSVFEPFYRRGQDHRTSELQETEALYERVRQRHARSPYSTEEGQKDFRLSVFQPIDGRMPYPLINAFYVACAEIVMDEEVIFAMPEFHPSLTMKEMVELREALRRKEHFFENEERIVKLLSEGIQLILGHIADQLPQALDPSPFVIPLAYALPEPKKLMDAVLGTLWNEKYVDAGVFVILCRQLHRNLCMASGIDLDNPTSKTYKLPSSDPAPLSEVVDTYLAGTPFHPLLGTPVPLKLTHEERFSHTHILGGTGSGKTQLLQNLILHDLKSEDPPSLIIVDSQGDLIDKVSRLAVFKERRLILITPKDIEHPPALNIFDLKRRGYDALRKEQVTAGTIETFTYLFEGLGVELTGKQGVCFRNMCRLMLSLPWNATILDLINITGDGLPAQYAEAVASLAPITRQFFENDFVGREFRETKQQIRSRLQGIIENPIIASLFTAPETKIDIFEEMNRGSVILVDTARDLLKGFSPYFGRLFISLVLQAVLERAVIPESERHPAFLIVDEAHEYFDLAIDDLLTEARKYKVGGVFAHQFLDQTTPYLRSSFSASTAIKLAGGVSAGDARFVASDMRTTQDFILSQPPLHFACHIRNVTPQAVSIPVEVGKLEKEPKLTTEEYEAMRALNRREVSLGPQRQETRPPPSQPPPQAAGPEQPPEPPPHRPSPQTMGFEPVPAPVFQQPEQASPQKRKRPKKRHGPLVGDIDTSA
jgi:hypothetical protein